MPDYNEKKASKNRSLQRTHKKIEKSSIQDEDMNFMLVLERA